MSGRQLPIMRALLLLKTVKDGRHNDRLFRPSRKFGNKF